MTDSEAITIELDADEGGVSRLKDRAVRRRGRGFSGRKGELPELDKVKDYETVAPDRSADPNGPQKSVEGWILFVTSVHEEASEEDLSDRFSEFGTIKNIAINLDRRTGFLKGYALIEYAEYSEACAARDAMNGQDILGQTVAVDWCFVKTGKKVKQRIRSKRR